MPIEFMVPTYRTKEKIDENLETTLQIRMEESTLIDELWWQFNDNMDNIQNLRKNQYDHG